MLRSASKQPPKVPAGHKLLKHQRSHLPFSAGQLAKLLFEPGSGTKTLPRPVTLPTLPVPPAASAAATTASRTSPSKKSAAARQASASLQKKNLAANKTSTNPPKLGPAKSSSKQFSKKAASTAGNSKKAPSTTTGRRNRHRLGTQSGKFITNKNNNTPHASKTPASKTPAATNKPAKTPLPKAPIKPREVQYVHLPPPLPTPIACIPSPPTIHNLTRRLRACRTNTRIGNKKPVVDTVSTADQQRDLLWLRVRKFKLGIAEAKKDLETVMACDTKRRGLNNLIVRATGGDEWVDEEEWGEPQEWWEEGGWDYSQEWGAAGNSVMDSEEPRESEEKEEIEIW